MRITCIASVLLLCCLPFAAQAKMVHQSVSYTQDGTTFHSVLIYDDAVTAKRPGLVMVPNWFGVNDYEIGKAEKIAGTRYVILLADLYGKGVRPTSNDQAQAAIKPLMGNRTLMRQRVNQALAQLKAQAPGAPIDLGKLAAIGFCFGGTAVLDLARSGADVAAVVSFHGGLSAGNPPLPDHFKARVLAMNGADDKGTMGEADAFMDEMRATKADWEFVVLGNAVHCFTETDQHSAGCQYDARAAARSYRLMQDWLEHAFAGTD